MQYGGGNPDGNVGTSYTTIPVFKHKDRGIFLEYLNVRREVTIVDRRIVYGKEMFWERGVRQRTSGGSYEDSQNR
jgi:hypothetical protein